MFNLPKISGSRFIGTDLSGKRFTINTLRLTLYLVVLAVLLLQSPLMAQWFGVIEGTVTDLETGTYIEDAVVTAYNSYICSDTTDANGYYYMEVLPDTFAMTVTADEYSDFDTTGVVVVLDDTTQVNFAMLYPEIEVEPTSIYDIVDYGNTYDDTLYITNNGNGLLEFNIEINHIEYVESNGINPCLSRLSRGIPSIQRGGIPFIQRDKPVNKVTNPGISIQSSRIEPAPGMGEPDFTFSDPAPTSEQWKGERYPGEILWWYDVQEPTGDPQCTGVEFDGTYYYVTGGNAGSEPNKIHIFDVDGNYITSVDQVSSPGWGWIDIAYDGNHMYSSDDSYITEWYITGLPDDPVLNLVTDFPGPLSGNYGLAYDPATDHFWSAKFSEPIYEFDRSGTVINSFTNSYSILGLAWDDVSGDGPWLWVYSAHPGTIRQFDPINGVYTGVVYNPGGEYAGGACLYLQEGRAIFTGLIQGGHDLIFGMEFYSWISAEPLSGTVSPGEMVEVIIHFNANMATNYNIYNAELLIHNNSSTPTITVPVTMEVSLPASGTIDGIVSEAANGPVDGAVVTAQGTFTYSDTTDANGYYCLPVVLPDTYNMTVTASGYNQLDTTGIVVVEGETTLVNFLLTYPEIETQPDSFCIELLPESTMDTTLYITNNGDGPLDFSISIGDATSSANKLVNKPRRIPFIQRGKSKTEKTTDNGKFLPISPGSRKITKIAQPEFSPLPIEEDTIHYDGENDGGIGLTDGGTYEAAIRLTPTELAPYNGWQLISVLFYHWESGTHSGQLKIYEAGTASEPGALITSEPYNVPGQTWLRTDLTEPITIDATQDLWTSVEITHSAGEHPVGCDAGPATPGKGDFIYSIPGGGWTELYLVGLNYNWNIRAIVSTELPPEWLWVTPTTGTVPPGETFEVTVHFDSHELNPGDYTSSIRIHNNSIDSLVNIPVYMHIPGGAIEGIVSEAENGPIEGAIVTADGYVDTTDANGYYFMELIPGTYDVTATASGYNSDTVFDVEVVLQETTQVNFTLTHSEILVEPTSFDIELAVDTTYNTPMTISNTGNGPLTFAIEVSFIRGKKAYSMNNGMPKTAKLQSSGNELYQVSRDGTKLRCIPLSEGFETTNHQPSTTNHQPPTTKLPRGIPLSEGFEGAWLPDGWSVIQTNTDDTHPIPGWWSQTDYSVHSGNYSAGLWWSLEHQDEWLISPEIFVSDSTMLSFWTYGYQGSTHGDHYYVKVSTDGGTTWDIVFDLSNLSGGWNEWAFPYEINLSQYHGQNVNLAWHAYGSNGIWHTWIIDDITVETLDWLTVEPDTGTVMPDSSLDVTLHFNTVVLLPDTTYHANLLIYNNSATPVYTVPVTLYTGTVDVEDEEPQVPKVFALSQNYPNPFSTPGGKVRNPQTTISYSLPKSCKVSLKIYNIKGQLVETLVDDFQQPGYHSVIWNAEDESSGIYFYRITAGNFTDTKKCVILK